MKKSERILYALARVVWVSAAVSFAICLFVISCGLLGAPWGRR